MRFIAILVCFVAAAFAAPTEAKTSSACVPVTTYDANFDNLPVNKPPGKYSGSKWKGFEVVASDGLLAPSSGNNYIKATVVEGSSVTLATVVDPNNPFMQLSNFSFGCVALLQGTTNEYIPTGCELTVKSYADFPGPQFGTKSYGPFQYTVDYTALEHGHPANMTQVDFGNVYGVQFFFDLSTAIASTMLFIDDVVLTIPTKDCSTT